MISKFLKEIDIRFPTRFTKEDLKRNLSKEIVGNNQPTKAATELLCIEKYLLRIDTMDGSEFKRTGKPHMIDSLDETLALHEPSEPIKATFEGGKYAYHEEIFVYIQF